MPLKTKPLTPPKTKWAMRKTKPWKSPKVLLLVQLPARKTAALQVPLVARKPVQWTQ